MSLLNGTLLGTLLAMAAIFLGLSLLVQVFQEIYKHLSKSKSRLYTQVLIDALGPWATQLLRAPDLQGLLTRGPLQWRRFRPKGMLLPLDKDTLIAGLERTAPVWVVQTLSALELEVRLQQGRAAAASPSWRTFREQLRAVEKGSPGYFTAAQIDAFLENWCRPSSNATGADLDAAALLVAFRHQFLPDVERAASQFPQLERHFDFAYRRRNLRQTFTLAFLVAVGFGLPVDKLYQRATALPPGEKVALAERAMDVYARMSQAAVAPDTTLEQLQVRLQELARTLGDSSTYSASVTYLVDTQVVRGLIAGSWWYRLRYLFGCLVTALLVCFGAPFWNDLAGALLRLQKGGGKTSPAQAEETE